MSAASGPIVVLDRTSSAELSGPADSAAPDAWYCGVDLEAGGDVGRSRCQDVVPELIVELL